MTEMTSMQRVLTTLGHSEPNRVPFFLLLTMHGAKELGLSIREYFSKAEHVVEGQLRLRTKYRHDCIYAFFYAPVEVEAFGGEVIYVDDGPPNSGEPFLAAPKQIDDLDPPDPLHTPCLIKVQEAIRSLKERVGEDAPIIGVVMSPFSLPVMQMGFESYLTLMHEDAERFQKLMAVNEWFCTRWANAQLAAGASVICYFDPVASPTVIPPALYRETGFLVAKRTIAAIKGPTATHLASGRCLGIAEDLPLTGTAVVGVSVLEDLAQVKAAFRGRLTVLGNLNGVEMRRWTPEIAAEKVLDAIRSAGAGGGFILSDNHGEIPWQVPDEVLNAISETVRSRGRYPLSM